MQFTAHKKSKMNMAYNFNSGASRYYCFFAQNVKLDEVEAKLNELEQQFGKPFGIDDRWMFTVERRSNPQDFEQLSPCGNGKWSVYGTSEGEPIIKFEVVFRDASDAVQFKLTHM